MALLIYRSFWAHRLQRLTCNRWIPEPWPSLLLICRGLRSMRSANTVALSSGFPGRRRTFCAYVGLRHSCERTQHRLAIGMTFQSRSRRSGETGVGSRQCTKARISTRMQENIVRTGRLCRFWRFPAFRSTRAMVKWKGIEF
jgi:hypothetical protein